MRNEQKSNLEQTKQNHDTTNTRIKPSKCSDVLEEFWQHQEALQHEHHVHMRAFYQDFYFCAPIPPFPVKIKV